MRVRNLFCLVKPINAATVFTECTCGAFCSAGATVIIVIDLLAAIAPVIVTVEEWLIADILAAVPYADTERLVATPGALFTTDTTIHHTGDEGARGVLVSFLADIRRCNTIDLPGNHVRFAAILGGIGFSRSVTVRVTVRAVYDITLPRYTRGKFNIAPQVQSFPHAPQLWGSENVSVHGHVVVAPPAVW